MPIRPATVPIDSPLAAPDSARDVLSPTNAVGDVSIIEDVLPMIPMGLLAQRRKVWEDSNTRAKTAEQATARTVRSLRAETARYRSAQDARRRHESDKVTIQAALEVSGAVVYPARFLTRFPQAFCFGD